MLIASITGDPAEEMYRQATLGDVDFITGDYLAGKYEALTLVCCLYRRLTAICRGQSGQQCPGLEEWKTPRV